LILTTQAWKQTLPPSDSDTVLYVSECLIVNRVGKNHDFFKKSKKSDFFDLNRILLI